MIEQKPPKHPMGTSWARWSVDSRQPDAVPRVRGHILANLACWGMRPDDEQPFTVGLVATELVTNAIRYGNPLLDLVDVLMWTDDGTVTIVVHDSTPTGPTETVAGEDDESGRGLALTRACARQSGWCRQEGGKRVWAIIGPDPLTAANTSPEPLVSARVPTVGTPDGRKSVPAA
ncbi:ATP-binding protein [Kitasatospora sp. NPDC087861]|uniref:ATP-binding protein n=1 Tax=Kitasatospora sp. NPDC087861 TaxID=3364070 RepID=UPI0037FDF333